MRWFPFLIVTISLVIENFRAETFAENDENVSNLTTVYDELATVTRITNAIALQSAAIKKTVKVREVITELLKADSEGFNILMTYDLKMLEGVLEELKGNTEGLRNLDEERWRGLESGRSWLDAVKDEIEIFQDSRSFHDFRINGIFDKIYDPKFNETLPCLKFRNLESYGEMLKSENDKVTGIQHIANSTQEILDCLQNLTNPKKLEKFQDLKAEIQIFQKLNRSMSQLKTLAYQPAKFLALVEKIYSQTKILWPNNQHMKRAGAIFSEVMSKLNDMFPVKTQSQVTLTIGFLEPEDMARVDEDLKSPWFLKKVARGKSSDILRGELDGFFKFGAQMKTLGAKWNDFKDGFLSHKQVGSMLAKHMKQVVSIENAQEKMAEIQKFKVEYPKNCEKANFSLVGKFDGLEILMEIHGFVGGIGQTLEKLSEISKKLLQKDLMEFKTSNPAEILKKFPDEQQFSNLKKLIELFTKLSGESLKVFGRIQKLTTEDLYAKGVMIRNTIDTVASLKPIQDCVQHLKTQNLNPQNLIDVVNYISKVRGLSNVEIIQTSQDVLQLFSTFREEALKVENFVKSIGPKYMEKDHKDNPILKLEHSQEMLLSLGRGMIVFRDMSRAWNERQLLLDTIDFPAHFTQRLLQYITDPSVQSFWPRREQEIQKMMEELKKLNDHAGTVKDKGILTMRKILDEAIRVHGFPEVFKCLWNYFTLTKAQESPEIMNVLGTLKDLDMDFSSHKGYLHAASLSFDELRLYFDEIFGFGGGRHHHEVEHNYLTATLFCVGIFFLILITVVLIFSLTKSGRKRIRKLYLYYFAKPEDFEKRWRYSLFMDRVEGKNALHDAVREINPTNTLKCIKKGAYINVYNRHGNTPLHVATKRGYPNIVEILIKNGADRSYMNSKNKTPEEMIPKNSRETATSATDCTERYEEVKKIYKKYKNRKFRCRVPDEFPWSSFHIFLDDTTDENATKEFTQIFQSVASYEALPNTTHRIVHTDPEGILDIDDLESVFWILSGIIIVRDTWMTDCLQNQKMIKKDCDYLVEKVRYKGVLYDTVTQWSKAMAKGAMPYLYGVFVAVVIPDYPSLVTLATIVTTHGGLFCSDKLPERASFKPDAHPYLHAHLGPIFLIHDGSQNLETFANDSMYTLFTDTEFAAFMLKRGINVDTRPDPVPVLTESDD